MLAQLYKTISKKKKRHLKGFFPILLRWWILAVLSKHSQSTNHKIIVKACHKTIIVSGNTNVLCIASDKQYIVSKGNDKTYPEGQDCAIYTIFEIKNKFGSFDKLFLFSWSSLERIIIGDGCCNKCEIFSVSNCSKLQTIVIGNKSFQEAGCYIQCKVLICN